MQNIKMPLLGGRLTLKQGYILALTLIFVVSLCKYITSELLISRQSGAEIVINVSGMQRMLSQRSALFASMLVSANTPQERTKAKEQLIATITQFENNHHDLIKGNQARQMPALNNQAIHHIYFGRETALDYMVKDYIQSVYNIIDTSGQGPKAAAALTHIFDLGPNALLQRLDQVVSLHEAATRTEIQRLSSLQKLFFLMTALLLLLEALLLFRPMEARIKKYIDALQKQEDQIQGQLNELKQFTYVASHDLQEPLRKISSFTERLQKQLAPQIKEDEKAAQYMDFILKGSEHLRQLVRGLYNYSNILSANHEVEDLSLSEAIDQICTHFSAQIKLKNATVRYENLPVISYNRPMLMNLLEELIGNSLKYSNNESPSITINATQDPENWTICIADNGPGIHEKFFDRIFTLFQRLHRKEDIAGTGVGLTIAKKIVERHNGTIWVTSTEGEGSRFYFTIPIEPAL